jgi:hypothetical protein
LVQQYDLLLFQHLNLIVSRIASLLLSLMNPVVLSLGKYIGEL